MKAKSLNLFCLFILFAITSYGQIKQHTVQQRVKVSMNKIAAPLKLDASQLGRMDSTFTEYYEAQHKILSEAKASGIRPDHTIFEKMLNRRDAKLKEILTPGQYIKFKNEIEESLRPQIKNHDGNQFSFF